MKFNAELEFKILKNNVDKPIVAPFEKEILALVDKFNHSGQSGGSAPFTAKAISNAVEELCMQRPLYGVMNVASEWSETGQGIFQNKRCSAVFKHGKDGRPYYIDAIIFNGDIGGGFTGNGIKLKDGSEISSLQYIKQFPFKPKSFYVDVIDKRYDLDKKTGKITPNLEGNWWLHDIKDENQLKEVFEYYDRM